MPNCAPPHPLRCVALAVIVVASSCGSSKPDGPTATTSSVNHKPERSHEEVFLGGFGDDLLAIQLDRRDPDAVGVRILKTRSTSGSYDLWFEGTSQDGTFSLSTADEEHRIEGKIEPARVDGTITNLVSSEGRPFYARPAGAGAGAGIYDITVLPDGTWIGHSLSGSMLRAAQRGDFVEGKIVTTAGQEYGFRHVDLTRRPGFRVAGGTPDRYMAVVRCRAAEIHGRGGDVKGGASGGHIALDLDQSPSSTRGVYQGLFSVTSAGQTLIAATRFGIELTDQPDGSRLLRSFFPGRVSPTSRGLWLSGVASGNEFRITSPGGESTLTGTIADDGISGSLELPDGLKRSYFAAPSGEGAGIYTVQVNADRHHTGTSSQGGKLDLRYDGGTLTGTVRSPEGTSFELRAVDLATAYHLPGQYSVPDTYVTLVLPRGRRVLGLSGEVQDGRPGTNLIMAEEVC